MKDAGSRECILTLSCPDATGIVHAVSGLLFQAGCNIVDSQQFGDAEDGDATGRFFMRVQFSAPLQLSEVTALEALFGHVRQQFGMALRFCARALRPRVLLMVSHLSPQLCEQLAGRAMVVFR
jgi:formyltetrahydrofolate deformylase